MDSNAPERTSFTASHNADTPPIGWGSQQLLRRAHNRFVTIIIKQNSLVLDRLRTVQAIQAT